MPETNIDNLNNIKYSKKFFSLSLSFDRFDEVEPFLSNDPFSSLTRGTGTRVFCETISVGIVASRWCIDGKNGWIDSAIVFNPDSGS